MENDPTELVSQMLNKLSIANEEEKKELLNEAKPYLLAPDASSNYKKYLEEKDFSVIFDCFNSANKDVIRTTCDILSRVFDFVEPNVIVEKYGKALDRALAHPAPEVKEVILKLLLKIDTNTILQNEA